MTTPATYVRKLGRWWGPNGPIGDPPPGGPGPTTPPTPVLLTTVPVEFLLLSGPETFEDVASGETGTAISHQAFLPLWAFQSGRLTASISASDLPVGALIVLKARVNGVWVFLDGFTSPQLAVDADTVADAVTAEDGVMRGETVFFTEAVREDVRVQAFLVGGDGATDLTIDRLSLQCTAVAVETPIDDGEDGEEPPAENPIPPDVPIEDPVASSCDADDEVVSNPWFWYLGDCGTADLEVITDVRGATDPLDGDRSLLGIGHNSGLVATVATADLNGRDTVHFAGGNYVVGGYGEHNFEFATAAELWFLFKRNSGSGPYLVGVQPAADHGVRIDSTITSDFGSDEVKDFGVPVVDLSSGYHLLRIQASAAGIVAELDGQAQFSTATNTVAWGGDGIMFNTDPFQSVNGDYNMAEAILYSRVLTESEAAALTQAIAARWGLAFGPGGGGGGGELSDLDFIDPMDA